MILNELQQLDLRNWFENSGYSLREAAKLFKAKSHVSVRNWIYKEGAGITPKTWFDIICPVIYSSDFKEKSIPAALQNSYKSLLEISSDKELLWTVEQNLRNLATITKEKNSQPS